MKRIVFLLFVFATNLSIYSQRVFEVHYRHVPMENMQEFEDLEMNHWYKVVQDAVNKGNLVSWSFHKRLDAGSIDFDEDTPTHAFVVVFKDVDQYLNSNKIWDNAAAILGADPNRFTTMNMSRTLMRQRYAIADGLGSTENGKYSIWNYAKPKDLAGFLEENSNLWKPFFEKNMKKNGMVAWGVANRIYPQGMDASTVLTWDVFSSLSAAMKHLSNTEIDPQIINKSKMSEYDPDGFRYRVIMQTLKRTKSK